MPINLTAPAKGTKVDVYKNLHNGLWSVRSRSTGRVIAHVEECTVENAKFVVQPAGRQRVLSQKRKNVHAFVRGDLLSANESSTIAVGWCEKSLGIQAPQMRGKSITYNPYAYGTFVYRDDHSPIREAPYASLSKTGVKAYA